MGRYFILAVMLYLLFFACYLVWERRIKRRQNAARKKGYNLFKSSPKEDIIGKSKFTLRQSEPQATMLEISDNREQNPSIFADANTPGAELQAPASGVNIPGQADTSGDMEIDLVIDNVPEGEDDTDQDGDLDTWETEGSEEETARGGQAQGFGFDDLAGMKRTVDNADAATPDQREEAGRVLAEVRMTEIINQVATDQQKRKVVSSLMDEYYAAYQRRRGKVEPAVKAPSDFNARGFA